MYAKLAKIQPDRVEIAVGDLPVEVYGFNVPGERIMKLPGGMNLQDMMKQAQKMQEDMAKEMQSLRVSATAGGGIVKVEMNGTKEVLFLTIDPEAGAISRCCRT
jgi:hypothetical protein